MTDTPSATSSTLLQQLRANSPLAWRRLVDVYGPVVFRWCRRGGVTNDEAADVVQEVFRSVAQHLDRFRREGPADSFRAWLLTITRNKVRDHFRRTATQPSLLHGTDIQEQLGQVPAPTDESAVSALPDDQRLVIQGALTVLRGEIEERTWTLFWRTTIDGHAAVDVARDLGMTAKAVRQAKYRVLQRLRQELADLEPDA